MNTYTLFVGTYTENGSEGIYRYSFDSGTGKLTHKKEVAKIGNPSFVKVSTDRKYLYAVEETDRYENSSGGVAAFRIEGDSLVKINSNTTVGAHPCHIGLSEDGRFVAVSSYTGGSLTIFGLGEDGALLPNPQIIDHNVLDTVKTSHAHSAQFTEDGLFVADLGLDAVKRYQWVGNEFKPAAQPSLDMASGAGPRHFTFGNGRQYLYVINELNSTLTTLERKEDGTYLEIETLSTLAKDFTGESFCADIHLSQDGKFLFGSNRGENTIVIFKVDPSSGKLSLVGRESVKGDWPRNFALDPSGAFLLVANQRSNNIVVFKRDKTEGTLQFLNEIALPSPVCLEFLGS
ncbi:lactonase family protein [Maribacter polysaccharolyticus]|uniref:lactonase family protein n=1 Tax=Maribacter polysaccharolyticus TaxID=3020831 RepID=UPI00237F8D56|nr:lactonase family protein [Maribacter polysaccharolyticus]MDE3742319.1 lactonase family protein [Maribacter polysaccharolyticus]